MFKVGQFLYHQGSSIIAAQIEKETAKTVTLRIWLSKGLINKFSPGYIQYANLEPFVATDICIRARKINNGSDSNNHAVQWTPQFSSNTWGSDYLQLEDTNYVMPEWKSNRRYIFTDVKPTNHATYRDA